MRLVNLGHDYAVIENTWTLGMVIKANDALDLQEKANKAALERAKQKKG